MKTKNPVAVIGGGPVGLATMAHLLENGENAILFEAGPEVAHSIKSWHHVRLFSPWKYNIDAAAERLLKKNGWNEPNPDHFPTGKELRERYLLPLYSVPEIRSRTRLNTTVIAVGKKERDKTRTANREKLSFVIHFRDKKGQPGILEAKAVIDTSGTWTQPNPIGAGGIPAVGEQDNFDRITYGIPDVLGEYSSTYRNKKIAVVGSGHSAMQVVLDLVQLHKQYPDTRILWVMRARNPETIYGGGKDDQLPERGKLGLKVRQAVEAGIIETVSPFLIKKIVRITDGSLAVTGDYMGKDKQIFADEIVAATGSRPDLAMIREVRTGIDPALESVAKLAPMIDPNIHSCGTVPPHGVNELKHPEENFFIAGSKSYGRAPTFLLMTGYEQVRSIVAFLTGNIDEAQRIELSLPDTGVCSTGINLSGIGSKSESCCGQQVVKSAKTNENICT
jgi:cation diffusion facilitator CzcD-associated flavoprotein CzcO